MGQIRKARGISRRKQAVPLQRYMKVAVAYLLLITVIFSNMSNPLMNVFAGQKKEEFRIHADELQRAAEEALEEENVVEEPLEIYTKDASLQKEYDELLAADGTLYEVFPEYERENDLDEIDLRIFLRLSEDADPKSYALTGEETFIFLYVNGGDETVAGRVNIDGYISGVCSLKSYAAVFDKDGKDIVIHSDTEDSTQKEDEIQQAQEEKETSEQKENTGEQAEEKKSHDTAEKDTTNQSDKNDTVNENKSQDSSSDTDTADTSDSVQEDTADAEDSSSDTDTSDQESDTEDTADSTDNSDSEDSASSEQEADDSAASDVVASISSHPRFLLTEVAGDDSSVELEETKEEIKAVEKEEEITVTKPAKETEAPVAEAETTVEETTEEETSAVETSAEETLPTETEETTAVAEETKASTEETTTEAQISDLPDDTNTAEEEDEPDFKRVGTLKGETYNLASLDQTVTIRAFTAKLSDMGLDKEELENQGHMIDYMIDPTGSAELVKTPKLARDGAEVTFGVIPQTGYKITEITANGTELEEVESEDIASPSNAERADNAVYYVIPEVLEDQEVEIFLEEEVPGSHPAFDQSKTVNGVTVSVTAEEGIIPEGTVLEVTEVTDQVKDAVIEKAASDESDVSNVTDVIAYDINLMLDGKKLNNDWGKNHHVNVKFSGERVEQLSKNADTLQVATLETPTETVEAALGGTEEMPVVDNITADNIQINAEGRDSIDVAGNASLSEVEFEAKHFSVSALLATADTNSKANQTVELKVGESKTINATYNGSDYSNYSWSSSDSDVVSVSGNSSSATIEGLKDGTVTLTCTYTYTYYRHSWSSKPTTKTVTDTFRVTVVDTKYDLYFYALIPGKKADDTTSANERWFGLGVGKIEGDDLNAPGNYATGTSIDDSGVTITEPSTTPVFPNITYNFDKDDTAETLKYAEIGSAEAYEEGHYTLSLMRNIVSGGANAGQNGYNPTKESSTNTFHRDYVLVPVLKDQLTVGYKVRYPGMSTFNSLDGYAWIYDKGTSESTIEGLQPPKNDKDSVIADRIYEGITYEFDGWYKDEACNEKADFDGILNEETWYYGRYVPKTGNVSLKKVFKTGSGDTTIGDATQVRFSLYQANDDGEFDSNATAMRTNIAPDASGVVSLSNLSNSQIYYLVETETSPGFILLTEPIKITVVYDNAEFKYTVGSDERKYTSENPYEIVNYAGAILPDTGGQGLDSIHRLGWSVILASVMFAGFRLSQTIKRKREE